MIDDFRPMSGGPKPTPPKDERDDFLPDLSAPKTAEPADLPDPEPFRTPEEIAAVDAVQQAYADHAAQAAPPVDDTIDLSQQTAETAGHEPLLIEPHAKKQRFWHTIPAWFTRLKLWQQILVATAIVLALGGIGYAIYTVVKPEPPKKKTVAVVVKKEEPPKPTTVANTLTGRQVAPEINKRQVTGVMIENSVDARPQAGLQQAGVVFEAIAEGGITRFLTLFQDTDPDYIGPVRSVRPYYISWAQGFDAAIAHVGSSPEALQIMRDRGLKDMDQSYNPNYFQRVTDRYAPHNVFTSIAQLRQLQDSKGFTSSSFTGFARAQKAGKPATTPTASNISLSISGPYFDVAYTYTPATNTYARTLAGSAHTDAKTGAQITPDVVIAMVVNYSIHPDGVHSVYDTLAGGKVYVFQNGTVTTGTWAKPSHTAQITFTDDTGKPILLNPGQTWITAASSADRVSYTP